VCNVRANPDECVRRYTFVYSICMGLCRLVLPSIFLLLCAFVAIADTPSQSTPYWAFCINPDSAAPAQVDNSPRHVPGSKAVFTVAETKDLFSLPDWHPNEHPPMPRIVSHADIAIFRTDSDVRRTRASQVSRRTT
jgi:hypothetical protein